LKQLKPQTRAYYQYTAPQFRVPCDQGFSPKRREGGGDGKSSSAGRKVGIVHMFQNHPSKKNKDNKSTAANSTQHDLRLVLLRNEYASVLRGRILTVSGDLPKKAMVRPIMRGTVRGTGIHRRQGTPNKPPVGIRLARRSHPAGVP